MITKIKMKIKRFISQLNLKFFLFKIRIKCNSVFYGTPYGGFFVCPEFLNESSIIYSFGIGEDISFDNDIIKNHNCHVFGFDPTPKSIDYIKSKNNLSKFHFYPFGIGDKNGTFKFFLPKNSDHVSGSVVFNTNIETSTYIEVELRTLQHIADELGHKKIDILKMDIEGSEFIVLDSIFEANVQIDQILIEFHDRFMIDGKHRLKQALKKLRSKGFAIFALTDSLEEVSFINKRSLKSRKVSKLKIWGTTKATY